MKVRMGEDFRREARLTRNVDAPRISSGRLAKIGTVTYFPVEFRGVNNALVILMSRAELVMGARK